MRKRNKGYIYMAIFILIRQFMLLIQSSRISLFSQVTCKIIFYAPVTTRTNDVISNTIAAGIVYQDHKKRSSALLPPKGELSWLPLTRPFAWLRLGHVRNRILRADVWVGGSRNSWSSSLIGTPTSTVQEAADVPVVYLYNSRNFIVFDLGVKITTQLLSFSLCLFLSLFLFLLLSFCFSARSPSKVLVCSNHWIHTYMHAETLLI